MSTDRTPIDRATEAYVYNSTNGLHARPEPQEVDLVRKVLSAALTNDADPDWLARVIDDAALMRTGRSIGLLASVDVADAVRSAILGADS